MHNLKRSYTLFLVLLSTFSFGSVAASKPSKDCISLLLGRTVPPSATLFASSSPVNLVIRSDFADIQSHREVNASDEVQKDELIFTDSEVSSLDQPDRIVKAKVRSRGHSSADPEESEFPKLRVEIEDSEKLEGTLFKGARNFRINTHVSTNPRTQFTAGLRRLNNENSPLREALGLALAAELGLATPAFRLARVTYTDTVTKNSFTRNGLLIETSKNISKRYAAKEVGPVDFAEDKNSLIDPVEGAIFHLFQRMIGNRDFQLRVNESKAMMTEMYRPSWNVDILQKNGKRFPVVYDLDVSTIVSGFDRNGKNLHPAFGVDNGPASRMVKDFSSLRFHFSRAQLMQAVDYIKQRKDSLYRIVNEAWVDDEGRAIATEHLNLFFANVDKIFAFNIVIAENIQFFTNAKKTKNKMNTNALTAKPGDLRVGTPIAVLGHEGKMLKVAIINASFRDLVEGEDEVGYIDEKSPIGDNVPASLLKKVDPRDLVL